MEGRPGQIVVPKAQPPSRVGSQEGKPKMGKTPFKQVGQWRIFSGIKSDL